MTLKKTTFSFVILMFAIALMAFGCGGNNAPSNEVKPVENAGSEAVDQTYAWKFAIEELPGGAEATYAEKFKEIVEEKSGGKITIQIFYLGQLGDGTDQVELAQNGAIDIIHAAACATGSLVPESNIFGLHYLFPDDSTENVQEFLHASKAIELLEESFYGKNLVAIDWASEGYNYWTSNKAIRSPEDMKGYKMRTMPAPIYTSAYGAYGANPTTIAYSEVYSSLQLNVVEGQSNPLCIVEEMKFYEVQDYLIGANQDLYIFGTFFNKKLWESLTPDLQQFLKECALETNTIYNQDYLSGSQETFLADYQDKGMTYIELTPEEKEAFKKLADPIRKSAYADIYGEKAKEILNLMEEELANWKK